MLNNYLKYIGLILYRSLCTFILGYSIYFLSWMLYILVRLILDVVRGAVRKELHSANQLTKFIKNEKRNRFSKLR